MDKPSGAEGRLPITSGTPQRKITRPERYEVDDTPLSPPGSNYLLFDSSSLFNSHPHKYRVLIRGNSKDDNLTHCPSKYSGQTPLGQQRSKSLVSLSTLEADSTSSAVESPSGAISPGNDHGGAIARDDKTLQQFLNSRHLARRRSSDSFIPDIRFNLEEPYLIPHDYHTGQRNDAVGNQLLRSLDNAASVKEDRPVQFQVQPFEQTSSSMSSGIDTSGEKKQSVPSSSPGEVNTQQPEYLVKEIQPEPRRLFGFGPLYRPLPEIVVEKQQPLTERVKQEGITAIGKDTLDAPSTNPQRKTSTGKETSMWMPFSF